MQLKFNYYNFIFIQLFLFPLCRWILLCVQHVYFNCLWISLVYVSIFWDCKSAHKNETKDLLLLTVLRFQQYHCTHFDFRNMVDKQQQILMNKLYRFHGGQAADYPLIVKKHPYHKRNDAFFIWYLYFIAFALIILIIPY